MKKWLKRSVAVLTGLIIFIVVGEVGYRAYIHIFKPLHRPSDIYGLLWEPTPGARKVIGGIEYKVNPQGFRDYEYAKAKDDGVLRIAVIGDSVTYGYTELEDTYPNIMERELRIDLKKESIEVLNFGIEGTDSQHQLKLLKERVLDYNPDIVVLGYCLNDIRFLDINPVVLWFVEHINFLDYFVVKSITAFRFMRARLGIVTAETHYELILSLYNDPYRATKLRGAVREMKTVLGERGVKFMVAVFPFKQQFQEGATFLPQETVISICEEEGIECLDTFSALKEYDSKELYLEGDPVHFSSFGNEVVGRSVVDFLMSKGLLEQSTGHRKIINKEKG